MMETKSAGKAEFQTLIDALRQLRAARALKEQEVHAMVYWQRKAIELAVKCCGQGSIEAALAQKECAQALEYSRRPEAQSEAYNACREAFIILSDANHEDAVEVGSMLLKMSVAKGALDTADAVVDYCWPRLVADPENAYAEAFLLDLPDWLRQHKRHKDAKVLEVFNAESAASMTPKVQALLRELLSD